MNQQSPNRQWYFNQLESMGPHASKLQNERLDIAINHLETQCGHRNSNGTWEVNRGEVLQHLDSIDFHKDVRVTTLRPGDHVDQYRFKTDREQAIEKRMRHQDTPELQNALAQERKNGLGQSFTGRGEPAQRLGVSGDGRERCTYTVQERTKVLQSHARDKKDTWSDQRDIRQVPEHKPTNVPLVNRDQHTRDVRQPDKTARSVSCGLKLTENAKSAGRVYRVEGNGDQKKITHQSGPYVRGGSMQYTITKSQHQSLKATPPSHLRKQIR